MLVLHALLDDIFNKLIGERVYGRSIFYKKGSGLAGLSRMISSMDATDVLNIKDLLTFFHSAVASSIIIRYINDGNIKELEFMLDHDVEPSIPSFKNVFPLDEAIRSNNLEAVLLIIEAADCDIMSRDGDMGNKIMALAENSSERIKEAVRERFVYFQSIRTKWDAISNFKNIREFRNRILSYLLTIPDAERSKFEEIRNGVDRHSIKELRRIRQCLVTELLYINCCIAYSRLGAFSAMSRIVEYGGSEALQLFEGQNPLYELIEYELNLNRFEEGALFQYIQACLHHRTDDITVFSSDESQKLLDLAEHVGIPRVTQFLKYIFKLMPLCNDVRHASDMSKSIIELGDDAATLDDYQRRRFNSFLKKSDVTNDAKLKLLRNPDTGQIFRTLIGPKAAADILAAGTSVTDANVESAVSNDVTYTY